MNKWMKLTTAAMVTLSSLAVQAETPDEAKALLDSAVGEIKTGGLDKALKDFNSGGKWAKGSLYLVVAKFDGTVLAHSANEKGVGKNMYEAKDASGKAFVQEAIKVAKASGNGQVDMRWGNPATKQIGDATLLVRRVPGQEAYVGSIVFR
jgi:cytochrome c